MAKLTRPAQNKVFGSSALSAELTAFGDIDKVPTVDIDTILNTSEAERGWGVVGVNGFPPMEWFNALGYGLSYYASYILQQGIAEWVATQDYYVNSRAIGSDGKEYKSLTGTSGTPNIGNDPVSDVVNWIDSFKAQIPTAINTATAKTTLADADQFGIVDSAESNVLKKTTWANIKAAFASVFAPLSTVGSLGTQDANSTSFTLTQAMAGKLQVLLAGGLTITLPTTNTIKSGSLFIIHNNTLDICYFNLNGNSSNLVSLKISGHETVCLQSDGGSYYRVVYRTSRTPIYTEAAVSFAYNTVFQADEDLTLIVLCTGSYMNGIGIYVGDTNTPSILVAQQMDDINSYTKSYSLSAVVPTGMYFKVAAIGAYAFETITITAYKHK